MERTSKLIERFAEIALEVLDTYARAYDADRRQLVEAFMDTLNALEQYKEQEE